MIVNIYEAGPSMAAPYRSHQQLILQFLPYDEQNKEVTTVVEIEKITCRYLVYNFHNCFDRRTLKVISTDSNDK